MGTERPENRTIADPRQDLAALVAKSQRKQRLTKERRWPGGEWRGRGRRRGLRRGELERGTGNPRTAGEEEGGILGGAAAVVTGGGVVVALGRSRDGWGKAPWNRGPVGAGLFCNLSPCLFYFIFLSFPLTFFESSAVCILFCASMREERER